MDKRELISVYEQVCKDIKNGYYINQFGEEINFEKVRRLKTETKMYGGNDLLSEIPETERPYYPKRIVYVENIDTFEKALKWDDPKNTAVLNMASFRNPGGGVSTGARAQEEDLCRRSNLLLALYGIYGKANWGYCPEEYEYPIDTYGTIFTPYVNIYQQAKTYEPFDEPRLTAVISASMVIRPSLDEEGNIMKKIVHIVKKKIRAVLRTAIKHNKSKLVLGAWGCGAYGCPAKHMAELFYNILKEQEFLNSFQEICFAILDDENAKRLNNPEGNYKPFKDKFGENK